MFFVSLIDFGIRGAVFFFLLINCFGIIKTLRNELIGLNFYVICGHYFDAEKHTISTLLTVTQFYKKNQKFIIDNLN